MPTELFHIVATADWVEAVDRGHYVPDAWEGDGFIHLSQLDQVVRPANLLYRGREDLLLLVIDSERLGADVRYEPGSHGETELFPHLYGTLDLDAVVRTVAFPPSEDGSFSLPPELIDSD